MASPLFPSAGDPDRKVNNINKPDVNSNDLAHSLNQLSLDSASAIALPPSSPLRSPSPGKTFSLSLQNSSNGSQSPPRTLRRTPSSVSLRNNSNSPAVSRSPTAMSRSPTSLSMQGGSPAPAVRTRTSLSSYHGAASPSSRHSSPAPNAAPLPRSPLAAVEDAPSYTPQGIACTHFTSELETHNETTAQRPANTIVILHDSCYGHRYSRPKTSKAALASIVERPERIQASVLGVSVAYVRLGGRHHEGRHPLDPKIEGYSLPDIPFHIRKTNRKLALSSPAVINVHGTKWMEELKVMCNTAEAKLANTGKELARDTSKTVEGLPGKLHEGDLYLCSESLDAMEGALGAVCEGVDAVFQGAATERGPSRAFVVIRPPGHHCSSNYPSGFCWLNNVHVGIQHAILNHGLTHAAIIDFDLHHGDGSQSIAWEHNTRAAYAAKNSAAWKKTSIGYFSLHDINSYPCEMGDEEKVKNASLCIENAHGQNIWNVHLEVWKTVEEFWEIYEAKYSVLLTKTRNFLRTQTKVRSSSNSAPPKAAIFFSAGFDASEWESDGMQRHKVNVPTEFYARLSRDVVKLAAEEGLGVDGRVISVLEGGYSDRALMTGTLSHLSGLAGSDPVVQDEEVAQAGLGHEMSQKLGASDGETNANGFRFEPMPYESEWWSLSKLEHLDAVINHIPVPVPEPYKPTRHTALGNFSTPTQAFIAKVVPHRRTSYGASISVDSPPRQNSVPRQPSPKPPPDVDWATAAHELSKLLIPSDRRVSSCRPDELSAAATKDRRERQSLLLAETTEPIVHPMDPPAHPTRMALRERKAPKSYADEDDEPIPRPASKAGRRKTVAGAALLATSTGPSRSTTPVPPLPDIKLMKPPSRRQSMISTTGSVASEAQSTASSVPPPMKINGNGRPETAQSMRGVSSTSVRVGPGRPAKPRAEAAKPSKPRKITASNGRGKTSSMDGASGSNAIPNPSSASNGASADDMAVDSLASGVGKIKLTLTTKAQRDAKEAEKVAKAPRKPAVPKEAKASSSKLKSKPVPSPIVGVQPMQHTAAVEGQPTQPAAAAVKEEFSTPDLPPLPIVTAGQQEPAQPQEAMVAPLPPSSPLSDIHTPQPSPTLSPKSSNVFIPYQPEGPPPESAPQPESLTWLSPNASTPANMKSGVKRHELPVFTSTSPIPFATSKDSGGEREQVGNGFDGEENSNAKAEVKERSPRKSPRKQGGNGVFDTRIWEVPETPEKS